MLGTKAEIARRQERKLKVLSTLRRENTPSGCKQRSFYTLVLEKIDETMTSRMKNTSELKRGKFSLEKVFFLFIFVARFVFYLPASDTLLIKHRLPVNRYKA